MLSEDDPDVALSEKSKKVKESTEAVKESAAAPKPEPVAKPTKAAGPDAAGLAMEAIANRVAIAAHATVADERVKQRQPVLLPPTAVAKPATEWKEAVDAASGKTYYYNVYVHYELSSDSFYEGDVKFLELRARRSGLPRILQRALRLNGRLHRTPRRARLIYTTRPLARLSGLTPENGNERASPCRLVWKTRRLSITMSITRRTANSAWQQQVGWALHLRTPSSSK